MAHQFVFTLKDLRKVVPPKREILRGIWLSFFPGAKIGVLGPNGAGKSTLLRIMAGVDKDFLGEAWPAPGMQDRLPAAGAASSTRPRTCAATSRRAWREVRALLTRFDEINARLGEPLDGDEMEKLLEEQAKRAGRDRGRATAGTSTARSRSRWTRSAARPATRT